MDRRFIFVFILILSFLISCGKEEGDILSIESETAPTAIPYLVFTGQDGNHRVFAVYTVDGELISHTHFRAENVTPRGLVALNANTAIMSGDTTDALFQVAVDGTKTPFHGSAQFNGGIYDVVIDPATNDVYAIESNRIEVFDSSGIRLSSKLINTTTGSCTLSNPRGMTLNASNQLVVVNQGGSDEVLTYDISGSTATCVSNVAFGNNPYGILLHSDGNMYITTQGDDQVYRADPDGSNPVVIWSADTSIINNPTGIVELANGDLLIASSATDTVERITTSGIRVGTTPFIQDSLSLNIGDMVILGSLESSE